MIIKLEATVAEITNFAKWDELEHEAQTKRLMEDGVTPAEILETEIQMSLTKNMLPGT